MKVKFLGWIASLAGKREMDVMVEKPVQLKEILPFSLQGRNVIVIVNNNPGSGETVVEDTDEIAVLPVISGG
ncbi:MAG: MoaD/ThiS family protein [Theionarchaea archaeon]|nr:MoaD/ThiS family protein [Theionarchaea archaeon]